jgi:hypothetical protein
MNRTVLVNEDQEISKNRMLLLLMQSMILIREMIILTTTGRIKAIFSRQIHIIILMTITLRREKKNNPIKGKRSLKKKKRH